MKGKLLTLASLCALLVALAPPASGIAATPTVTHANGSDSGSTSICGLDINYDFKFSAMEILKSSGITLDAGEFTSVWTNPASGKSIMLHGASNLMSDLPIDNGDGTISFIQASAGNYIVKATDGAPISLQAFRATVRVTLDAATGDVVSVELLSFGGNYSGPSADSSCDSIVAALT